MKGVLLAGGVGSRLKPLTNTVNKHILPVGRYPMIYHPLRTLYDSGINQVMIVTGKEHLGTVVSQLGSGSTLGMDLTYKVQDEADGIAGALRLVKDFINNQNFAMILGDNIFTNDIKKHLGNGFNFSNKNNEPVCKLFFQPMAKEKLTRFGVPEFDQDGSVKGIVEKPKVPPSKYCVTGLYVYDKNVWKILDTIEKSKRAEFEISDVNSWYAKNGFIEFSIIGAQSDCWFDAGTPETLIDANIKMSKVIYDGWRLKDI